MEPKNKIPYKVSDYIKARFQEDFLFEVKEVRQVEGHSYYTVQVSKDDLIHTLKFNEKGALLSEECDEAFPTDMHDARGFDDLP